MEHERGLTRQSSCYSAEFFTCLHMFSWAKRECTLIVGIFLYTTYLLLRFKGAEESAKDITSFICMPCQQATIQDLTTWSFCFGIFWLQISKFVASACIERKISNIIFSVSKGCQWVQHRKCVGGDGTTQNGLFVRNTCCEGTKRHSHCQGLAFGCACCGKTFFWLHCYGHAASRRGSVCFSLYTVSYFLISVWFNPGHYVFSQKFSPHYAYNMHSI